MTIQDYLTVNWDVSPRIITVVSGITEISIQDLHDTCRYIEAQQTSMDNDYLIDTAGKEFLGGTTYVALTATLNNAVLAFEARGGPQWVLCKITGGNLVATDESGTVIDPRHPTAYTTVDRAASSSATLIVDESEAENIADTLLNTNVEPYTVSGTVGEAINDTVTNTRLIPGTL